jgi:NAD-dependent SIR2 family protein deacetylase
VPPLVLATKQPMEPPPAGGWGEAVVQLSGFKRPRDEVALSTLPAEPSERKDAEPIAWIPQPPASASDAHKTVLLMIATGSSPLDILEHLGVPVPDGCTLWDFETFVAYCMAMFPIPGRGVPARKRRAGGLSTITELVAALLTKKHIVVVSGAGISVSCGIPDFRSPQSGLYDIIKASNCQGLKHVSEPQELFDYRVFLENPSVFYSVAPLLYAHTDKVVPSIAHQFLAHLDGTGRLCRVYSQNVDGLELDAGVKNVIQCHGSIRTMSCIKCNKTVDAASVLDDVMHQRVPHCTATRCKSCAAAVLKPDAVFFHESLPAAFEDNFPIDLALCDLLIVLGSSLRVRPVADCVARLKPSTPAVLINREPLGAQAWDLELLGDCDIITQYLQDQMTAVESVIAAAVRSDAPQIVLECARRYRFPSGSPPAEAPDTSAASLLQPALTHMLKPSRAGRQVKARRAPDGEAYDLSELSAK